MEENIEVDLDNFGTCNTVSSCTLSVGRSGVHTSFKDEVVKPDCLPREGCKDGGGWCNDKGCGGGVAEEEGEKKGQHVSGTWWRV